MSDKQISVSEPYAKRVAALAKANRRTIKGQAEWMIDVALSAMPGSDTNPGSGAPAPEAVADLESNKKGKS